MKRAPGAIFLAVSLCVAPSALLAQDTGERFVQERLVENLKQRERERYVELAPPEEAVVAMEKKLLMDSGGWFDVYYTEFHDDDNDSETKDTFDADLSVDTRVWVKALWRPTLKGDHIYEHSVYARFRNFYISRWPDEEQPDVLDDNDGPHVDLLHLDVDLRWVQARVGRQYLELGQGIAYSNVHDGISVAANYAKFSAQSFVVRTLPHEENIDFSVPGFDKRSERYFVGTQLNWYPRDRLALYQYFLIQRDESDADPESIMDFTYDSESWGVGGTLSGWHGFSTWFEGILETGESAIAGSTVRKPVLAHAANVGLHYVFPVVTHPDVTVEYAIGTGDPDRTSVTNTLGGNLKGKDRNFLPFGVYPAGSALAPTLSNIQIFKVGASVSPLERWWHFRAFSMGVEGYSYWKDETRGGIYDLDATVKAREIGREIDAYARWPIASDLILYTRYAVFFPGNAYPLGTNDPEHYLSLSLTFSF